MSIHALWLLSLLFGLSSGAAARPQCGTWDPDFAEVGPAGSPPGVAGQVRTFYVFDLAAFDDGSGPRLCASGEFDFTSGVATNRIAAWDGAQWSTFGGGIGVPFSVNNLDTTWCLAAFDAGAGPELYAGGYFTSASGTPASRIARWNGTSWSNVGPGLSGGFLPTVTRMTVASLGGTPALYAGGEFDFAGSTFVGNIARWNGTSWSALGSGLGGSDTWVWAFAEFDDGSGPALYVGGDFSSAGGVSAARIARWNGSSWSDVGGGVTHGAAPVTVRGLAVFDDGAGAALYAAGWFSAAGGQPANGIARWNGTSWSSVGTLPLSTFAYDLEVFDDGSGSRLYASHSASGGAQISRWDGALWSPVGGVVSSIPWRLATYDDGGGARLFASGNFESIEGVRTGRLARWNGAEWEPPSAPPPGVAGTVRALARFDDGSGSATWAGGALRFAGALATNAVARWNGTEWSAAGALAGTVQALLVHDDGTGAAMHAGTSGAGTGVWRWNGSAWTTLGATNGSVMSLASVVFGGTPLLVAAGQFTTLGGAPANNVAQWNGTSWSALGSGTNGLVRRLCVFDSGTGPVLYATGDFSSAGGVGASSIARWNGTAWSAVGAGLGGAIYREGHALHVHDDGTGAALYVGGLFATAGGLAAHNVARWNGTTWSTVGLGTPDDANSTIRAFATFDETGVGAALYAGGDFVAAGGAPTKHIARWQGGAWSTVASGIDGAVHTLLATDPADGRGPALLAGGVFNAAGNASSQGIASLRSCRITSFCAGDGSLATPCPCANTGASGHGCAWSGNPSGATLVASGGIAPDTLMLHAAGMPLAGSSIFLKGSAIDASGIPFGDGVRCVDGGLVRMAILQNVGGAVAYPGPSGSPVSVRGGTPVGSGLTAAYQTYFRAAANYCTPATFNVTNGLRIVW